VIDPRPLSDQPRSSADAQPSSAILEMTRPCFLDHAAGFAGHLRKGSKAGGCRKNYDAKGMKFFVFTASGGWFLK
jgi:hypothetical protein